MTSCSCELCAATPCDADVKLIAHLASKQNHMKCIIIGGTDTMWITLFLMVAWFSATQALGEFLVFAFVVCLCFCACEVDTS